jgi:hypothetical protein
MRSRRSPSFLRPANTILVPGTYFLGLSKYSKRVSSPHTIPASAHAWLRLSAPCPCSPALTRGLVARGVRVPSDSSGSAADQTVKVGALLGGTSLHQTHAIAPTSSPRADSPSEWPKRLCPHRDWNFSVVCTHSLDSVTLGALGLENLGSLRSRAESVSYNGQACPWARRNPHQGVSNAS